MIWSLLKINLFKVIQDPFALPCFAVISRYISVKPLWTWKGDHGWTNWWTGHAVSQGAQATDLSIFANRRKNGPVNLCTHWLSISEWAHTCVHVCWVELCTRWGGGERIIGVNTVHVSHVNLHKSLWAARLDGWWDVHQTNILMAKSARCQTFSEDAVAVRKNNNKVLSWAVFPGSDS